MSAKKNKKPQIVQNKVQTAAPAPQPIHWSKRPASTQHTEASRFQQPRFQQPGWLIWAILAITALIFSKTLTCQLTSLDDDFYIINNADLRNFSTAGFIKIITSFYCGNYHPLTMAVYFVMFRIFQLAPAPYHLLNLALHLVNVWLAYKIAGALSGKKTTAIVVAILFALHPLRVESVVWASELKDVLYTLFYFLAISVYLRREGDQFKTKDYIILLALFLASLCAKSAAVTLPLVLVVIDLYRGRKPGLNLVTEKTPLFIGSLIFGVLAIISQKQGGAYNGLMISYGPVNTFFLFTSGLAFYLLWLPAPIILSIFHYFPDLHGDLLPWPYYASLPVVAAIAWLAARRNPLRKETWFGMAFFLAAISVMLQVVSVGSALTAERYTYVAYLGLFYTIGQFISWAIEGKQKNLAIAVFSAFALFCAVQTWNRIDVWKDDMTLFNDLVTKNPDFYYGYWLRGNTYKKEGDLPAAIADYSKSIELNPTYEDAYYNRGIVNNTMGNVKAAVADYTQSIKLNPKQADSYNNRGWGYYQLGDTAAAMRDYNTAITLKPNYPEAYNNRAWAYDQQGNTELALKDYTRAIALMPEYRRAIFNRGALKLRTRDYPGAMTDFTAILKFAPDDQAACFLLGNAYQGAGDVQNACASWEKARQLGNPDAAGMLGRYCR